MSSYGEYLSRMQQRLPTYIDTRPRRDAGHQTEIFKRIAASANLESVVVGTTCSSPLDTNTILSNRTVSGGGHSVQDVSSVLDYVGGQAVAQSEKPSNAKASQITAVCYSSTVVPELNDRIAADPQLALKYAAKNALQNCCTMCKKVVFANQCACVGSKAFKSTPS